MKMGSSDPVQPGSPEGPSVSSKDARSTKGYGECKAGLGREKLEAVSAKSEQINPGSKKVTIE